MCVENFFYGQQRPSLLNEGLCQGPATFSFFKIFPDDSRTTTGYKKILNAQRFFGCCRKMVASRL